MTWRKLLWTTVLRFRDTATVDTRQGRFTVSCSDQVIGKALYCRGDFEVDLMLEAVATLQAADALPRSGGGTLLDVGANIGPIAIGMLHHGLFERAIAIEPDPANFALLRRNVAQNGLEDRILCLPCAVSDREGSVAFERSANNLGDHRVRVGDAGENLYGEEHRSVIEVPTRTLDQLLADAPDAFTADLRLLWIDVQGHEAHAFRGARTLLRTGIPVVAEVWPYGLRRAGTSEEDYLALAGAIWSHVWIRSNAGYTSGPVSDLARTFARDDARGRFHENVLFTS